MILTTEMREVITDGRQEWQVQLPLRRWIQPPDFTCRCSHDRWSVVTALLRPRETVDDADWLHLMDNEEIHWMGRPSRVTLLPALIFATLLIVGVIALAAWLGPIVDAREVPRRVGVLPLVSAAIGLVVGSVTYLRWLRLLYVVTSEEIYVKYGLVSRDITQIRLDRVQNTAYTQSVLERVLSFGDVEIYTLSST